MKNKAISPLMAATLLVAFTLAVAIIAGIWLTYMWQRALEDEVALENKVFVVFHDCDTGEYIGDGYFNVTNGTIINISISGKNVCGYIYEVKK